MDGKGVLRFPEGSGRQGRVERYWCNVIRGAPTTSEIKGLRDEMRIHLSVLTLYRWKIGMRVNLYTTSNLSMNTFSTSLSSQPVDVLTRNRGGGLSARIFIFTMF